jgi:hypothetical protein
MNNYKAVIAFGIIFLIVLGVFAGWKYAPREVKYIPVPGPKIKDIVYIKVPTTVTIKVPQIQKDLPPEQHVTTIGEVPPSSNTVTVASVIDEKTGVSKLIMKEEALEFIALENFKEIGVRYGVGTDGLMYEAFARWSFLRIGEFHVSAYTELSNRDAACMLELAYRW